MFHLPGRGTTALTVKSSPPKTAQTATRLGVRAGVLTKRDERGAWQRRYCALVPQTLLFYYDDETSDDARGIIDLEYYGDVQIVRGRTLRLATASDVPLRSFFFQAETEEQAQKWCEALSRERYFVVADERDAYRELQGEFSTTRAQDDESCAKMREASSERNAAASLSEKRAADALEVLREQALSLGLAPRQAAALTSPAAAAREVAHRLHFCGRRRDSLERALQALETSTPEPADAAEKRQSTIASLRAKLASQKQKTAHASTTRLAADARRDAALQSARAARAAVASAASRRSRAERSAAELVDQKRVLVREVRERRARLDDARRVSSSLEHASDLPAAVAGLSVDDAVERLRRGSAPMVG